MGLDMEKRWYKSKSFAAQGQTGPKNPGGGRFRPGTAEWSGYSLLLGIEYYVQAAAFSIRTFNLHFSIVYGCTTDHIGNTDSFPWLRGIEAPAIVFN